MAIRLSHQEGIQVKQVATGLDIHPFMLSRWRKEYREGKFQANEGISTFIKIGETSEQEVLTQIGEPLGYREQGNRSAMIYVYYYEDYYFLLVGSMRKKNLPFRFGFSRSRIGKGRS